MTITPERRAGIRKQAEQYPDLYADDLDLLTALEEVERESEQTRRLMLVQTEFYLKAESNYDHEIARIKAERDSLRAQLEKADLALYQYADSQNWSDILRVGQPTITGWLLDAQGWTKARAYLSQRSQHEE